MIQAATVNTDLQLHTDETATLCSALLLIHVLSTLHNENGDHLQSRTAGHQANKLCSKDDYKQEQHMSFALHSGAPAERKVPLWLCANWDNCIEIFCAVFPALTKPRAP